MGKTLSIREARAELTRIDELLESNREITITRRGKPIAKVVALDSGRKQGVPSHADLRSSIGSRIGRLRRGTEVLVRADRNAR